MWGPPLLLLLAGVVGLIFAIPGGNIGTPYLIAFAAAAFAGVALVDPRGLFITVAQLPLLFTIITPLVAWFTASFADPSVGGALESTPRRTRAITAAYPIIQYFPWIALITLIALAIALWRYLDVTRANAKAGKEEVREKREVRKADEKATASATKARRRIAESDARRSRHSAGAAPTTGSRPASEIIRAAEERRKRAAAARAEQAPRPPERGPRPERDAGPRPAPRRVAEGGQESRRDSAAFRRGGAPEPPPSRQRRDSQRDDSPTGSRYAERPRGPRPQPEQQRRRPVERPVERPASSGEDQGRRIQEWPPRRERPRRPAPSDPYGRDSRDPRQGRDPRDARAGRDPRDPREMRERRDYRGDRDASYPPRRTYRDDRGPYEGRRRGEAPEGRRVRDDRDRRDYGEYGGPGPQRPRRDPRDYRDRR